MKLTPITIKFLFSVATLGHLSNRDAAQICWPAMGSNSALVTAQNLGKRMVEAGLVLVKTLPCDRLSKAYVLTMAGAEALNSLFLDRWIESDCEVTWFTDGYGVSLNDNIPRRPLVALVQQMTAAGGLLAVGQRSAKRGFMGLKEWAHFDAVLVDEASYQPVWGVYLAHSSTDTAGRHVRKLAAGPKPFLIAADTASRLSAMRKWRASVSPEKAADVHDRVPPSVVA